MAFNGKLLLLPSNLSYDWQMGSISLIETFADIRNALTISLTAIIGAFVWKYWTAFLRSFWSRKSYYPVIDNWSPLSFFRESLLLAADHFQLTSIGLMSFSQVFPLIFL